MMLLVVNNNKNVEKKSSLLFAHTRQASKRAYQSLVLIKDVLGLGKESITLSMNLLNVFFFFFYVGVK